MGKQFTNEELIATLAMFAEELRQRSLEKKQLLAAAQRDALSGLLNRHELEKLRELEESDVVLMMDIDKFKQINDAIGHVRADKAIVIMGDSISRSIRDTDLAYRYGGDEFLIIFRGCPHEKAVQRANQISERFQTRCYETIGLEINASVGIYSVDRIMPTMDAVNIADEKLYKNKSKINNGEARKKVPFFKKIFSELFKKTR